VGAMVSKIVKLKVDEDDWRAWRVWCAQHDLTVPQAVTTLILREVGLGEPNDPDNSREHRSSK